MEDDLESAPPFDPNKPHSPVSDDVSAAPPFDPSKPHSAMETEEKSLIQDAYEGTSDFLKNSRASMPGGQWATKAAAYVAALASPGDTGKNFEEFLKENDRSLKESRDRSPIGSALGTGFGYFVGPGVKAGPWASPGLVSRTGLSAGLAAASADPGADQSAFAEGAKAGGIQLGAELLPRGLKAAAKTAPVKWLGDKTLGVARDYAIKAAHGAGKKSLETMDKMGKTDSIADALLDGVVKFGSDAKSIAARAGKKADDLWSETKDIMSRVTKSNPKAVDGSDIGERIIDKATKLGAETPENKGIYDRLANNAAFFEKKGPMSIEDAHELKKAYQFKYQDPTSAATNKDINTVVRQSVQESMEDSASKLGGEKLGKKMREWGTMHEAEEMALKRLAGERAQGLLGGRDTLIAGAVGAGETARGGFTPESMVKGLGAGLATKFMRGRGSSMIAKTAHGLSKGGGLVQATEKIASAPVGRAVEEYLKDEEFDEYLERARK